MLEEWEVLDSWARTRPHGSLRQADADRVDAADEGDRVALSAGVRECEACEKCQESTDYKLFDR